MDEGPKSFLSLGLRGAPGLERLRITGLRLPEENFNDLCMRSSKQRPAAHVQEKHDGAVNVSKGGKTRAASYSERAESIHQVQVFELVVDSVCSSNGFSN